MNNVIPTPQTPNDAAKLKKKLRLGDPRQAGLPLQAPQAAPQQLKLGLNAPAGNVRPPPTQLGLPLGSPKVPNPAQLPLDFTPKPKVAGLNAAAADDALAKLQSMLGDTPKPAGAVPPVQPTIAPAPVQPLPGQPDQTANRQRASLTNPNRPTEQRVRPAGRTGAPTAQPTTPKATFPGGHSVSSTANTAAKAATTGSKLKSLLGLTPTALGVTAGVEMLSNAHEGGADWAGQSLDTAKAAYDEGDYLKAARYGNPWSLGVDYFTGLALGEGGTQDMVESAYDKAKGTLGVLGETFEKDGFAGLGANIANTAGQVADYGGELLQAAGEFANPTAPTTVNAPTAPRPESVGSPALEVNGTQYDSSRLGLTGQEGIYSLDGKNNSFVGVGSPTDAPNGGSTYARTTDAGYVNPVDEFYRREQAERDARATPNTSALDDQHKRALRDLENDYRGKGIGARTYHTLRASLEKDYNSAVAAAGKQSASGRSEGAGKGLTEYQAQTLNDNRAQRAFENQRRQESDALATSKAASASEKSLAERREKGRASLIDHIRTNAASEEEARTQIKALVSTPTAYQNAIYESDPGNRDAAARDIELLNQAQNEFNKSGNGGTAATVGGAVVGGGVGNFASGPGKIAGKGLDKILGLIPGVKAFAPAKPFENFLGSKLGSTATGAATGAVAANVYRGDTGPTSQLDLPPIDPATGQLAPGAGLAFTDFLNSPVNAAKLGLGFSGMQRSEGGRIAHLNNDQLAAIERYQQQQLEIQAASQRGQGLR